jgi:hypothetical protein
MLENNLDYFDFYETPEAESIPYWNLIKLKEEQTEENQEFIDKLLEQIQMNNLDEHIFQNYQPKDFEILKQFLIIIHNDIIPITNIESILINPDRTVFFSYIIYEILFHDFYEIYLDKLKQKFKIKSDTYFYKTTSDDFKIQLFQVFNDIVAILNLQKELTPELQKEKMKISTAIDLFDNNLEEFYENFVLKLTSNYNMEV